MPRLSEPTHDGYRMTLVPASALRGTVEMPCSLENTCLANHVCQMLPLGGDHEHLSHKE
jgi:hypothetical protein